MKYKIIIIAALLLIASTITYVLFMNHGKPNKTIYPNGIGEIKIGDSYDLAMSYCKKMGFEAIQKGSEVEMDERGLFIYDDNSLIITIGNKNWGEPPFIVRMIDIYATDFKTEDGIHVGMPLKELLKILPDSKLEEGMDDLFITPEKINTGKKSAKFDVVFALKMEFKNNEDETQSLEELNKNINSIDAVIGNILIYDAN